MPTGPCRGGNFRPGWQAFVSIRPQCMLPLAAQASRLLPQRPLPRSIALFLFSLLHHFSPAVNLSRLSPHSQLHRLRGGARPPVGGTTPGGPRKFQHPVRLREQAASLIRKHLAASPVALLFGSEKRGLSNDDFSHCHWLLRIPTCEEHRSMNLGQAVAICLYELSRNPQAVPHHPKPIAATAADLKRLTPLLLTALPPSGYWKASPSGSEKRRSAAPTQDKIRRLVRRLHLSATDAELTLGILRQIFWKLGSAKTPLP